jgi:multidrug efflux pump subunit AcrA (membrane-fusion protein)
MGASVKILNHTNSKAIVVPVNIVQSDEKGKYVYTMKDVNGKKVAHKNIVSIGELHDNEIEIINGLASGDILVTMGYQNLYEGQLIINKN